MYKAALQQWLGMGDAFRDVFPAGMFFLLSPVPLQSARPRLWRVPLQPIQVGCILLKTEKMSPAGYSIHELPSDFKAR